ncbi:MAG: hypothetical protein WCS69_11495 [Ignavibacteriaceae bacterium]|jgi:hypothetical protein
MILNKMMISCESATLFVSQKEEHRLSITNRMKLLLHLAVCKFCRLFEQQNSFLIHQIKHISTTISLTENEKEELQSKINSELKK